SFFSVEHAAIGAFNDALGKNAAHEISDKQFGEIIDREILPPWRALQARWSGMGRVPRAEQARIADIGRYLALRERSWALLSESLRAPDPAKEQESNRLQREADAMVRKLSADKD